MPEPHPDATANRLRSVLLVGCGQVGTEVGTALVGAGTEVTAIRRDTSQLPPSFTGYSLDLTQPITQALPPVDAVVITLTPTMPEVAGRPGYLVALEHLAHALPELPARVILVSSTRVFEGHDPAEVVTEATPVAPVSDRGRLLVAAEHLAVEHFGAIVLRPAGIYGQGREWLLRTVGNATPVHYARRTNRIHQTDLAQAIIHLLTTPGPPAVLHAVDDEPGVPLGEVVTYLAERLGVPPPPDTGPQKPHGRIITGDLLRRRIGQLRYPTFRAGYDAVIG